ncbi:hypothetical protein N802_18365 [Knoellia sinensis KCTC 19936]|uniref:Uncharacterized protein n=1 Tax=Knoellia sinensis KCTC 19936 TaxID=1385520 RepID=A0A0A0J6B8_9MICO|nr:hypothetical protein [Knoellia sinensis]KGN32329.1 hypothetical protein N802_18365 [Knoellia sinensis KCTC 19936]
MRWDQLFDDLEAQLGAEERRERDSEIADRTRRERASVELAARCAAAVGERLRLRLVSRTQVQGELLDLGDDWLLLRLETGREAVVPIHAVAGIVGLPLRASAARTARRFGLGYALRGLSRDRTPVALTDTSGQVLTGTIDIVGADSLDLSEHAPEESRRTENVRGRQTVPFAAVALIEAR